MEKVYIVVRHSSNGKCIIGVYDSTDKVIERLWHFFERKVDKENIIKFVDRLLGKHGGIDHLSGYADFLSIQVAEMNSDKSLYLY